MRRAIGTYIWLGMWLLSGLWLLSRLFVGVAGPVSEYNIEELAVLQGASAKNLGSFNVQDQLVGGAGAADNVQRAFLASEAGVQIIPVNIRADHTAARGINDLGEVVGASNTKGAMRGFRWSAMGGIQDLAPLPGDSSSEAFAVNRNGDVVGISSGQGGIRAVRWTPSGAIEQLPGLPINTYSRGLAISNQGAVAGSLGRGPTMRAFFWAGDQVKDLGVLPGDAQSEALAINEAGDVVGWSKGPNGTRAVLWSSGQIHDLGALYENAKFTRARAISVRGEIVGGSVAGHQSRAFIWSRNQGMRDLNSLIPASFAYILSEGVAINNRGHIIAIGHGIDYRHDIEEQGRPNMRIFILKPGGARTTPRKANATRSSNGIGYDYCGLPLPVVSPTTFRRQSGDNLGTAGML